MSGKEIIKLKQCPFCDGGETKQLPEDKERCVELHHQMGLRLSPGGFLNTENMMQEAMYGG